jgi:ATP-dependent RNA helicase RhlE
MLRRGVDVLVACPGRLLDLMQQGFVSYSALEVFVLDEADRMLDMGFIHDVKRVIQALPKKRQTLFFSATMPPEIQSLANNILSNPARVEVTPASSTAETVDQKLFFVEKDQKRSLLVHLLGDKAIRRVLVFTRTKHGANRVAQHLEKAGITAAAIHGNKSQGARERALAGFKDGDIRALVATDIAARGIDIDGLTHVVNFDLPNIPESYVHRIGRTGRAGASGTALSFCDYEERAYLKDIERTIRRQVAVVADHPYRSNGTPPPPGSARDDDDRPSSGRGQQRHGGQRHGGGGQRGGGGGGGGGGGRRRSGGGGRPQGQQAGSRSDQGGRSQGQGGQRSSAPAAPAAAPAARPGRPMPKWL